MLVLSLTIKIRKRLAPDVVDRPTFALRHSGLVSGLSDRDCWVQYGSNRGRVFALFMTSIFHKPDEKSNFKKQQKNNNNNNNNIALCMFCFYLALIFIYLLQCH